MRGALHFAIVIASFKDAFEAAATFLALRTSHFRSVKLLMCALSSAGFMGGGGAGGTLPPTTGTGAAILAI